MLLMKQLLLRVDDEVHARLHERARREGRSVNTIAGDILTVAANVDPESPRDRLKARAAALGMLLMRVPEGAEQPSQPVDLDEVHRMTRGWGPLIDDILAEDRDRL